MGNRAAFLNGLFAARDPLEQPKPFLHGFERIHIQQIRRRPAMLGHEHGLAIFRQFANDFCGTPLEVGD